MASHENRLVREKSPYLLQHAHNPVDWYPWGTEAFKKAQKEDRPIFLSIGYSTCHWCHVMEHESFENEEIARILNENFVSIKVDREERPDVDQIYMNAVQVMTGSGGWPLSAFLTHDLEPFFTGTYFPPEGRYGHPGFKDLLMEIGRLWRTDREKLVSSANEIGQALKLMGSAKGGKGLSIETLRGAYLALEGQFDAQYGGFGGPPKFPHSDAISLLLRIYRRTGEKKALHMATFSLEKMARGGIYDHTGGGFHRYATDAEWLVPHFEKMLYDNALLSKTYLEAYQIDGNPMWAGVVRETLDYILREMTSPEGGFYSAKDADSEGIDDKVIASWNGLMISAMAFAARVLQEGRYLEAAQKAADFIVSRMWDGKTLKRRYRDGEVRFNGSVDDYAFLIQGLLDLYETDFDSRWFEAARALQKKSDDLFWDAGEGGYFMTDGTDPTLIARVKDIYDGAVPSGNSVAALNCLRLYWFTLDEVYEKKAGRIFQVFSDLVSRHPQMAPALLAALDFATDDAKEIVVAGLRTDPEVQKILRELHRRFLPNAVLGLTDHPDQGRIIPLLRGITPQDARATIYLCEGHVCRSPVHSPEEIREGLERKVEYKLPPN